MCILSLPFAEMAPSLEKLCLECSHPPITASSLRFVLGDFWKPVENALTTPFVPFQRHVVSTSGFGELATTELEVRPLRPMMFGVKQAETSFVQQSAKILSLCPLSKKQVATLLGRRHELGNWDYPPLTEEDQINAQRIREVRC